MRIQLLKFCCILLILKYSKCAGSDVIDAKDLVDEKDMHNSRLVSSVHRKAKSLRIKENNKNTSKSELNKTLSKALKKALGGGLTGAVAGIIQVLSLMWLRTIINHQYRYGTTLKQAMRILYNEGGISRFYRGISFALIQAPLSRFGSTAANDGVNALLSSLQSTKHWGVGVSTIIGAFAVGLWRIFLMPIDTCKTVLQVESFDGFKTLLRKVKNGKISVLYQGSLANAVSSFASHYPWFYTYNILNNNEFFQHLIRKMKYNLLQDAFIGFMASVASDVVANSIRVVKTTKQSMAAKVTATDVSYYDVIQGILAADGWSGLFGRGLKTKVLANGLQSIIFVVCWKGLKQRFMEKDTTSNGSS